MHVTRLPIRWPDFDAIGHINHAVHLVYLDEARDDLLQRAVGDFSAWPNVVVHVSLDFKQEIRLGVREIVVQSRIDNVGESSVTFEQEVLAPNGEVAVACRAILVAWDPDTRRSRAITDAERAALLGNASR